MKNVAVIPARGSSKRLPRKNMLDFNGKPMLLWTVDAARASGGFSRIIISSEDEEILAIGREYGCEVSVRPERLATDAATCAEVCLDILDRLEAEGESFDALCNLYATAPLRNADDIRETMALLGDDQVNRADFACAVTGFINSPYQMLVPDPAGYLTSAWPLLAYHKSQALPAPLVGNGSTYAVRVPAFRRYKVFSGPRMLGHEMPRMRSIDIDTREEYELALFASRWCGGV